ncbi:amidohydrolase family protein [Hoeflea sp.]|uniref:amidohydrolase family protein n=1 Tax=Hoeflea sp. TaxID=1940281 RepID=UPI003B024B16
MGHKSDQRIVDAHIHWWDLENNYYPWLMDKQPEEGGLSGFDNIAKTYLYDHYMADADGYDIEGFVHIQAEWDPSDPVGETRWLQALVDNDGIGGRPLAIVGFANFAAPNIEEILEGHAAHANARGVRHMLNHLSDQPALCWADQDYLQNDAWLDNFPLLKKYGLDFDPMCFSNHLPGIAELAGRHPEIRVILEHTGMPHDHTPEGRDTWSEGMRQLAARDNTAAKISGLGNTIEGWTEELIRPYVLETIDIFGTDRVSFASNFPTDSMFSDMPAIWDAFLSITRDFSQDEKDAMFADNAKRLYGLD